MPETLVAPDAAAEAAAAEAARVAAEANVVEPPAKTPEELAAETKVADDAKAAETKAAQEALTAERAKIVYDLKVPDGVTVTPATLERTVAIARAQGLSPEAGQALLDNTLAELQTQDAARIARWEPLKGVDWIQYNDTLKGKALADPEIGGSPEKLANSVELAQSVLRVISDGDSATEKQFQTFLTTSGLASHPDAIRLLSRIGKRMAEPALLLGASASLPGKKSMKDAMYPGDGTGPKPTPTGTE